MSNQPGNLDPKAQAIIDELIQLKSQAGAWMPANLGKLLDAYTRVPTAGEIAAEKYVVALQSGYIGLTCPRGAMSTQYNFCGDETIVREYLAAIIDEQRADATKSAIAAAVEELEMHRYERHESIRNAIAAIIKETK